MRRAALRPDSRTGPSARSPHCSAAIRPLCHAHSSHKYHFYNANEQIIQKSYKWLVKIVLQNVGQSSCLVHLLRNDVLVAVSIFMRHARNHHQFSLIVAFFDARNTRKRRLFQLGQKNDKTVGERKLWSAQAFCYFVIVIAMESYLIGSCESVRSFSICCRDASMSSSHHGGLTWNDPDIGLNSRKGLQNQKIAYVYC